MTRTRLRPRERTIFSTKFFPAKFWDDAHKDSWTRFRMTHDEVHTVNESSSTSWVGWKRIVRSVVGAPARRTRAEGVLQDDGNTFPSRLRLIRVAGSQKLVDPTIFLGPRIEVRSPDRQRDLSDGANPPSVR
jgi:hypothetical protein